MELVLEKVDFQEDQVEEDQEIILQRLEELEHNLLSQGILVPMVLVLMEENQ